MSSASRRCICGAPLPPSDGTGTIRCRACGKSVSASAPPDAPPAPIPAPHLDLPEVDAHPVRSAPRPITARQASMLHHEKADAGRVSAPGAPTSPAGAGGGASMPVTPPAARLIGQPALKADHAIKFQCGCGQTLHTHRVPGSQVMCPACGQVLDVPSRPQDAHPPSPDTLSTGKTVFYFECQCRDLLRSEDGIGSGVMCLNCGRESPTPADARRAIEFRCACQVILETDEQGGAEVICPACQKSVPVPTVDDGKG